MSKNIDKLAELAARRNELVEELKTIELDIRFIARDVVNEKVHLEDKPAVRKPRKQKKEAIPHVSTSGPGGQSDHTCMATGTPATPEEGACLLTLWEGEECLSLADVTQRALEPGFAAANGLGNMFEADQIATVKSWMQALSNEEKITRSGKGRGTVYSVTTVTTDTE